MSTRLSRLWQPGSRQGFTFLPNFWLVVASTHLVGRSRLPKNCVKFEVDCRMSKRNIKNYLSKIYKLPVRDVKAENHKDIFWSTPADRQYKKAMWKEDDKKCAYVFMKKDFEFTFPSSFCVDEESDELRKVKEQQTKITVNSTFVNRDRKKVGEFFGV